MKIESFLKNGKSSLDNLNLSLRNFDIAFEYSFDSCLLFLELFLNDLSTSKKKEDVNLPNWIKSSDMYKNNLFDFKEQSKDILDLGSFIIGETFVRTYPRLKWSLGKKGSLEESLPTIVGFKNGQQFCPRIIIENLVRRILMGETLEIFKTFVNSWKSEL